MFLFRQANVSSTLPVRVQPKTEELRNEPKKFKPEDAVNSESVEKPSVAEVETQEGTAETGGKNDDVKTTISSDNNTTIKTEQTDAIEEPNLTTGNFSKIDEAVPSTSKAPEVVQQDIAVNIVSLMFFQSFRIVLTEIYVMCEY